MLDYIQDKELLHTTATDHSYYAVRQKALHRVVTLYKDDPQAWQLVRQAITNDTDTSVRIEALQQLMTGQADDPATKQFVYQFAISNNDVDVRRRVSFIIIRHHEIRQLWGWFKAQGPDLRQPIITSEATNTRLFGMSVGDQVKTWYEECAAQLKADFDLDLKLEWQEENSK